jgi:hypothetical protein
MAIPIMMPIKMLIDTVMIMQMTRMLPFYPEDGGFNDPKRPNQVQHERCEAKPSPHRRLQFVFVRMHYCDDGDGYFLFF